MRRLRCYVDSTEAESKSLDRKSRVTNLTIDSHYSPTAHTGWP
jgi:hypothetical protein